MKILVHDLEPAVFAGLFPNIGADVTVIDKTKNISRCVGCFGCWVKTPSSCVIKDDFQRMGALLNQSESLNVITQCTYGCYSPFVKNVIDRSVNWALPFFVKRGGEMHHPARYGNRFDFMVHFYGADITDAEKATAEKLVKANTLNLDIKTGTVCFYDDINTLKGVGI